MKNLFKVLSLGFIFGCALPICGQDAKQNSLGIADDNGLTVKQAATSTFGNINIKDNYNFNEVLYLNSVNVKIDGVAAVATPFIEYPSGKRVYEKSAVLNEYGIYKVTYCSVVNGKYYTEDFDFSIKPDPITIGQNSSYSYTVPEHSSTPSLYVSLAKGESITFNTPIDLTKITTDENLLEAFVCPKTQGVHDFRKLYFKFEDITDPTNYMIFYIHTPDSDSYMGYSQMACQADGTNMCAFIKSSWKGPFVSINGTAGTQFLHSFNGHFRMTSGATGKLYYVPSNYDTSKIEIKYDYDNMITYVKNSWLSDYLTPTGYTYDLVNDFDEPYYNGSKLWGGFKTGKVRLSVYADGYENEFANFAISKAYGLDLTSTEIIDDQGPEITFVENQDFCLGKVGYKYKIPAAKAVDSFTGEVNVKSSVWFNYGSNDATTVDVREGCFYPTKTGNYTVVYAAKDGFGNESKKALNIVVGNTSEPIIFDFKDEILHESITGKKIAFERPNISGGLGDKSLKIEISHNQRTFNITNSLEFTPEESGEYFVKYTAEDYVGERKVFSKPFNVIDSNLPVLRRPINYPMYLFAYSDFKLPSAEAYLYSNGNKELVNLKCEIQIGEETITSNPNENVHIKSVPDNSSIEIKYLYNNEVIDSKLLEVVNPLTVNEKGSYAVDFVKYFRNVDLKQEINKPNFDEYICEGCGSTVKPDENLRCPKCHTDKTLSTQETGVVLSPVGGTGSFTYANPVLAELFVTSFSVFKEHSNFSSIDFTLIDFEDLTNTITFTILYNKSLQEFSLKSKEVGTIALTSNDFKYLNNDYLTFSINYSNKVISSCGYTFEYFTNDLGQTFNGFKSDKIYLKVKLNEFAKDNYMIFNSLNLFEFNQNNKDFGNPQILKKDFVKASLNIGDIYTTPLIVASDLLAPNCDIKISVKDETGKYLTDVNGVTLNNVDGSKTYDILIDKYMKIQMTFKAIEKYGKDTYWPWKNETSQSMVYYVQDNTQPILDEITRMQTSCKVNDVLGLSTYIVSDNVTASENIIIQRYMILPSGSRYSIPKEADSFKFTMKGIYEFRFFAIDEAGNMSLATTYINVK